MALLLGSGLTALLATVMACLLYRLAVRDPRSTLLTVRPTIRMEERYLPMQRVLARADFDFLARQPGLSRQAQAAFRRQRRVIFRSYLRCLARDFNRIFRTLELLILESDHDRPDLVRLLLRLRSRCIWAMLAVEVRLTLDACGFEWIASRGLLESVWKLWNSCRLLLITTGKARSQALWQE
jgi:hypothetical protein